MKTAIALAAALAFAPVAAQAADVDPRVAAIQSSWAHIKYQVRDTDAQAAQMEKLAGQADALVRAMPGRAEPLIWDGIVTSTLAGMKGGFGALGLVKSAKSMFEAAEKIDPKALDGSAETSLGSLYYQVPGFPIGFGSSSKAKSYLTKGLAMNPNGIDANYFWADFLFQQGDYAGAVRALEKASAAAPRPGREVADQGRRGEIADLMAKAKAKLHG
jgi:tetratricopeptide (TPR) repeat protein